MSEYHESNGKDDLISSQPLDKFRVNNLCCESKDGKKLLKDISFEIKPNTINVISGKTGSGKTTLLRSICGLYPISDGEIFWNDTKITNPKEFFIPPMIAYTPQSPKFLSDTVKNNITLGKKETDLQHQLYQSVLEKDILTLEQGQETIIGSRGMRISGGQLKRIAAARMFYEDCYLYAIDDVSCALDKETELTFWNRLKERNDKTYIIVSNSEHILQQADHIILLSDGMLEGQGTLNELIGCSESFRKMIYANSDM